MDRLLSDEEMIKEVREYRRILELNGHRPTTADSRYAIAFSQANHSETKTLQAVGEWLDNAFLFDDEGIVIELSGIIDQLKQGKMPE